MTKQEQVQYLVNLLAIMDSKESSGQGRSGSVAREYLRTYSEFVIELRKADDDEARQAKLQRTGGSEDSANQSGSEPLRRSPDRERSIHDPRA